MLRPLSGCLTSTFLTSTFLRMGLMAQPIGNMRQQCLHSRPHLLAVQHRSPSSLQYRASKGRCQDASFHSCSYKARRKAAWCLPHCHPLLRQSYPQSSLKPSRVLWSPEEEAPLRLPRHECFSSTVYHGERSSDPVPGVSGQSPWSFSRESQGEGEREGEGEGEDCRQEEVAGPPPPMGHDSSSGQPKVAMVESRACHHEEDEVSSTEPSPNHPKQPKDIPNLTQSTQACGSNSLTIPQEDGALAGSESRRSRREGEGEVGGGVNGEEEEERGEGEGEGEGGEITLGEYLLSLDERAKEAKREEKRSSQHRGENKWWRSQEHYRPRRLALDESTSSSTQDSATGVRRPSFPYEDRFVMKDGRTLSCHEVVEILKVLLIEPRQVAIERTLSGRTYSIVPVVEGLADIGNVAAVSRSSEAMGCQQMHVIWDTTINRRRYRRDWGVSKGADKWLDVETWGDSEECLKALKASGYRIAVTHVTPDTVSIHDMDWTIPTAVVFGNEKRGVSATAVAMSDICCTIPMMGFVESFNISVAAGILLHHVSRDRVGRQGFHGDLTEEEKDILRAEFYLRHSRQTQDVIALRLDRRGVPPPPDHNSGFRRMLRGEWDVKDVEKSGGGDRLDGGWQWRRLPNASVK